MFGLIPAVLYCYPPPTPAPRLLSVVWCGYKHLYRVTEKYWLPCSQPEGQLKKLGVIWSIPLGPKFTSISNDSVMGLSYNYDLLVPKVRILPSTWSVFYARKLLCVSNYNHI